MKALLSLVTLAALGILLAGCLGRGVPGGYTKGDLQRQPEAQLAYPGATPLAQGSREPEWTVEGQQYAVAHAHYGTSATAAEVEDFYGRELAARGWRLAPEKSGRATNETRAVTWRKGDLLFRLGIMRKNDVQVPRAYDAYTTAFEVALIVSPPGK